jgi:UDP-N-acetylglucosamine enolpyruvyl transferase
MFESAQFFVDKLISMGARIVLCDPHRAIVYGHRSLSGMCLCTPDVRAGLAMVIADASAPRGTSVIHNVVPNQRGYENPSEGSRRLAHTSLIVRAGSPASSVHLLFQLFEHCLCRLRRRFKLR